MSYGLPLLILLLGWPSYSQQEQSMLNECRDQIHFIWTNWMGKPKLEYERISKEKLDLLCGVWEGVYLDGGERLVLDLSLKPDGTWASRRFRPQMIDGHWYLVDGMILLYEEALSKEGTLASALTKHGATLRLIIAERPQGYVELKKKTKPEPDGVANRSQPVSPQTNRPPLTVGSGR